jgi:hypothetical protein
VGDNRHASEIELEQIDKVSLVSVGEILVSAGTTDGEVPPSKIEGSGGTQRFRGRLLMNFENLSGWVRDGERGGWRVTERE